MIPTKEPTRPDPLCPFVHAPFFERANTGRGNLNRVGNLEFNLASFFRPFVPPFFSVTYTEIRLSVRGPREKTEAVKIKGTAKESSGNSLVARSVRSVIENGLLSESVLERSLLQVYLVCSFSTGREFIVVSLTDLKRYPLDCPWTQRPPCSANWRTPVA